MPSYIMVYLFNLLQNHEMYTGLVLLRARVVMPSVKIYVYIAKMPRLKNASCCKRKIYFHAAQHNKRIVAYFTVAKADRVQTGVSGAVLQFPPFYIHARFPLNALTKLFYILSVLRLVENFNFTFVTTH